MAIQDSGDNLQWSEIQTEYGGSNPIAISEYYGSGGVSGSGQISISEFYGTSNAVPIDASGGR